jgi:hypothetical protein
MRASTSIAAISATGGQPESTMPVQLRRQRRLAMTGRQLELVPVAKRGSGQADDGHRGHDGVPDDSVGGHDGRRSGSVSRGDSSGRIPSDQCRTAAIRPSTRRRRIRSAGSPVPPEVVCQ